MNCTVNSHIPAGSAVLSMRARKTWAPRRLLTGCADVSASCCSECSIYTECSTSSEPTTVHHPTWWSSNQSSKSGTARRQTAGTVVLEVLQRSNALFVGDRSNALFMGDRDNFVSFFCGLKKAGQHAPPRLTGRDAPVLLLPTLHLLPGLLSAGGGLLWLSHCRRGFPGRPLQRYRPSHQCVPNAVWRPPRIMTRGLTAITAPRCAGPVTPTDLLCQILTGLHPAHNSWLCSAAGGAAVH